MKTENAIKYAEALEGISYRDWQMLKVGMDRMFQDKLKELEPELKLSDIEQVGRLIQSQFGNKNNRALFMGSVPIKEEKLTYGIKKC